jgi:hypothetical protein
MVPPIDRFLTVEQRLILRIVAGVIGGLFVVSGVLALVMFSGSTVAVAGMVLFSLLLFVGGPMWLATIQDALEHEHEHPHDASEGPHHRAGAG